MSKRLAEFSPSSGPWGLHWFRRDLRVAGNEALRFNFKKTSGRTLGIFCFDSRFLSRPDFSHNRFAFFMESLKSLRKELQVQGGDLLIVDQSPVDAFQKLIRFFDENSLARPSLVTWNRDYEPFARDRDERVLKSLRAQDIEVSTHRDHLIFEPYEVLKDARLDSFYQVYSPFAKKWFQKLQTPEGQERIKKQNSLVNYYKKWQQGDMEKIFQLSWKNLLTSSSFPFHDALIEFAARNQAHVTHAIPEAGSWVAYQKVLGFKNKLESYKDQRDLPAEAGTSRLSVYFKNGSLVSSQVVSLLGLEGLPFGEVSGANQFLKEIVWREFYYSILFHRPDVETQSFLPQFRKLAWEDNPSFFQRWTEGTTGFPIVDAGLRELQQTGWMHNRVRMIVASFLTKDLLINWQSGENYFMKTLLDGDLAPNNGGWQWAASTGCDPQPYFRIFNPWLQSEKFDPDAHYIKKWIPELQTVSAKNIHDPEGSRGARYPKPIVDHKIQKEKALALYKKFAKSGGQDS